MKTTEKSYSYLVSIDRIDTVLDSSDNSFPELNYIPSEDKLTYTNGFYVYVSALFIDIRGSSQLPNTHRRPKLAKLYRVYISEVVAILNGETDCKRIDIVGDGISGVFDTPSKPQIDQVFNTAAKISSVIDIMNYKFEKRDIKPIKVGIGLSYGRALIVKAGYKGSGINEIIWMGDVVNEAAKLCSYANSSPICKELMVSDTFYSNLKEHNQNLLSRNVSKSCYHGHIMWPQMDEWLQNQIGKDKSNSFW